MDPSHRCDIAIRVIEATIGVLDGHFHKGANLKAFYRVIRAGQPRAFVVLRADSDDFVALLMDAHDDTLRFDLWVDRTHRDDGPLWHDALRRRFLQLAHVQFVFRSPDDPLRLARSMHLVTPTDEGDEPDA